MKYIELLNRIANKQSIPTHIYYQGYCYKLSIDRKTNMVGGYYWCDHELSEDVSKMMLSDQVELELNVSEQKFSIWSK